jgi:hypothetical protein
MKPSQVDADAVLRNSWRRAQDIAHYERELERLREMRAVDARWLVMHTDLTRTSIAGVLGISRVTLDKYIDDGGLSDEYLAELRRRQDETGIVRPAPDISGYLDTGEQE